MLGHEVERHLAEKHVGANSCRCRDTRLLSHRRDDAPCECSHVEAIERLVGRHVEKSLVNAVWPGVLAGHVAQVDGVHLCRDLHVAMHPGHGSDVGDALGYLAYATAVPHPLGLERGGYGQADGVGAARWIRHHEVCGKGVKAPVGALYACVERLEVDCQVGSFGRTRIWCHGSSAHS